MAVLKFQSDTEYYRWLADHPNGFVVNTTHSPQPRYMMLHRALCRHISEPHRETSPGGFTERRNTKICAEDIESLRAWAAQHGRPDGSFTHECSSCTPTR